MKNKHEFIPCNIPLYAVYEDEGKEFTAPIIGFDVEYFEDGGFNVTAMDMCSDGLIETVASNIIRIQSNPIFLKEGD